MGARTILLTGASGVIGKSLVPELAGHRVICLLHRADAPAGATESIRSDVADTRLGLDRAEYRRLAREVDCVIHSAALTDWAADAAAIRRVNEGGTENVIRFASDAGVPLYHLSTSFIRAVADDAEVTLDDTNVIVNYCRSKAVAEEAVQASGLAHTIFRPTNLIGDSRSGEIAATQAVQLVSELICRGKAPLIPSRAGTLVDVIPQDLLAKTIARAVDTDDLGQEWWVTYGGEAMRMQEALDICVAFMARLGQPIEPPEVIDPREVHGSGSSRLEMLSPMALRFFGKMLDFNEGLAACGVFPSSLPEIVLRYELPLVPIDVAYERGLEYWALQKGICTRIQERGRRRT